MGAGAIRPPFYFGPLRGPPMRATRPRPMIDRAVRPIAAAEAMEHAFAKIPGLGRRRPDVAKLANPIVDLKAIVTHPPILQ